MSRLILPEFKSKSEAFDFLRKNHDKIISFKKAEKIKSEECGLGCKSFSMTEKGLDAHKKYASKSLNEGEELKDYTHIKTDSTGSISDDEIEVKAYANVIGWCDSHMDVLIKDSAKKTISDKGASNRQLIYHLKDHGRSVDDIVGGNVKMSLEEIALSQFNIQSDIKKTQAIVGESIVKKRYDEKVFNLYVDNEIKQHSIGLFYVKIHFCMDSDDPEDATYQDNWNKYYSEVINKDKVSESGYFWAVTQIKLVEYSSVLWGSNELSITDDKKSFDFEPSEDTKNQENERKSSKDTDSERRKKIRLI